MKAYRIAALVAMAVATSAIPGPVQAGFPGRNGRIYLTRDPGRGSSDIYSINRRGTGLRRLIRTRGHEGVVHASPSGKRLAYNVSNGATYDGRIMVIGVNGRGRREVADLRGGDGGARWSPSGKRIVFHNVRPSREGEIYIVGTGGKGLTRMTRTRADELSPVWSPDGDRIAMISSRRTGNHDIWTMSSNGGDWQRVTVDATLCERGCEDGLGGFSGLDYAPDGDRIVFAANQGDGASEVWVVDEDGTHLRKITNGQYPAWSPNGRWIVYSSQGNLFRIPARGGRRVRLTTSRNDYFSTWAPRT